jgi:hypothetical protein
MVIAHICTSSSIQKPLSIYSKGALAKGGNEEKKLLERLGTAGFARRNLGWLKHVFLWPYPLNSMELSP